MDNIYARLIQPSVVPPALSTDTEEITRTSAQAPAHESSERTEPPYPPGSRASFDAKFFDKAKGFLTDAQQKDDKFQKHVGELRQQEADKVRKAIRSQVGKEAAELWDVFAEPFLAVPRNRPAAVGYTTRRPEEEDYQHQYAPVAPPSEDGSENATDDEELARAMAESLTMAQSQDEEDELAKAIKESLLSAGCPAPDESQVGAESAAAAAGTAQRTSKRARPTLPSDIVLNIVPNESDGLCLDRSLAQLKKQSEGTAMDQRRRIAAAMRNDTERGGYNIMMLASGMSQTPFIGEKSAKFLMRNCSEISNDVYSKFLEIPGTYAGDEELFCWSRLEENRDLKILIVNGPINPKTPAGSRLQERDIKGSATLLQNHQRTTVEPEDLKAAIEHAFKNPSDHFVLYKSHDHWALVKLTAAGTEPALPAVDKYSFTRREESPEIPEDPMFDELSWL
jgi:hypothetical protein